MKAFVNSRTMSDISFDIEGTTFVGHKVILASRSAYLRALLLDDFKEKDISIIPLEVNSSIFR
jgi:hypothetical protein